MPVPLKIAGKPSDDPIAGPSALPFEVSAMNPSLECELARVQMKRYLGGEELPPQLMEELEQHVHACASCSHYLDAQRLKLAAKLSGGKPKQVKEPKAPTGPKDTDVFTKPKQVWLTPKTMGLAAALALVLFAMSAVAKDPTLLFGPKASSARPAGSLTGDPETNPPSESEGEPDSHGEKTGEEEKSGADGHSTVGEIMTGETIQKEIEASQKSGAHSESGQSHEADPEKPAKDPEAEHTPASDHSSDPVKKPDSHSEPAKPVKEPVKEPDMALVVAEEGKTTKKAAPAPHPKAVPAGSKAKKPAHRSLIRRSTSSHRSQSSRRSSPPAASRPSSGGSIRVYDSSGNPLN
jgi:hypothetical protein